MPEKHLPLFHDYAKAFDSVDHNKLWKVLQEMGIPDHLTCLLRNLYADQEVTVRIPYGTTDWFKVEKGVRLGCLLSPCLFNLHVEHIMRNAGLDELQAGIKIGGRNISNLRYMDDTTLIVELNRHLTLSTKVHRVKIMVFPVVTFGCESWTVKKAEHQIIDAFELLCWRRL